MRQYISCLQECLSAGSPHNHAAGKYRMKQARLLITAPLLLIPATLHAREQDDDIFFEIPVVLSAARLEQPVAEAPIAVSTIDRQMIEASGARNIPDLLRYVPGMLVGHALNEFGDEPRTVVAFQGHSDQYSRQMQVLIDGRSIYEPVQGGVNWNSVPINVDDIERIEVIRGPNASSYGSNSFLAVINIITRLAAEDSGQYVRSNVGNHAVADITYRYAEQGDALDYRITLTRYGDDGQDGIDGARIRDGIRANVIDYRLDFQLDDNHLLTYQGGYSDSDQQARGGVRPGSFVSDRTVENVSAYQFVRYESILDENNTLKVQYYYNLFDKTDRYDTNVDFGSLPLDDDILNVLNLPTNAGITGSIDFDPFIFTANRSFRSQRHNLELTHFYEPDRNFRLIWGGGLQKDLGSSPYYFGTNNAVSREIYRVFSNLEGRPTERINVNLGLLWEKSDIVGTTLSPRLSLLGKLGRRHTLRIGYSEAIRTLFLAEQFSMLQLTAQVSGTVNIDTPAPATQPFSIALLSDVLNSSLPLQNERIIAREIGYYGRFMNDDLTLSARVFHNSLSGLIDVRDEPSPVELVPGGDGIVEVFDNLIDTTVRGLDIELDYYFSADTRILLNTALLDIDAHYDPNDITATFTQGRLEQLARKYRQSAPDHSFTTMIIHRFNDTYSGSLSFFYVGDMSWIDVNRSASVNDRRNTGGYRKADIRLTRKWRDAGHNISLSLVLQNILGPYQDYDATAQVAASEAEQNLAGFVDFRLAY